VENFTFLFLSWFVLFSTMRSLAFLLLALSAGGTAGGHGNTQQRREPAVGLCFAPPGAGSALPARAPAGGLLGLLGFYSSKAGGSRRALPVPRPCAELRKAPIMQGASGDSGPGVGAPRPGEEQQPPPAFRCAPIPAHSSEAGDRAALSRCNLTHSRSPLPGVTRSSSTAGRSFRSRWCAFPPPRPPPRP